MVGAVASQGVRDRVLLVFCALTIGTALLGWMFMADRLMLRSEHRLFLGGAVVYSATALYCLRQVVPHQWRRLGETILAVIAVESPLPVFFALFTSGLIPWPPSILPYLVASIVLGPLVAVGVARLLRARAEDRTS